YNEFKSTNRVVLILETYNAPQVKGVISQCELFIGARTHATIAAYSTTVPTLVLGYSVKAKGIARDLFGDEKGLVLPVNEIDDENTLISAFNDLYERKDQLKQTLIDVLPSYIQIALSAVKHLKPLL
ncbi:MAG: polysaccharide pyruvyl transferase family protein, partial [Bacillota bacterium]|nr:polysaccharide pyruvyl transferase family protein [Bacillota bacterium]